MTVPLRLRFLSLTTTEPDVDAQVADVALVMLESELANILLLLPANFVTPCGVQPLTSDQAK